MCIQHTKSNKCESGQICYDGHLCCFCLQYGHKKVFTDKEEKEINDFLEKNKDLMEDLRKQGD